MKVTPWKAIGLATAIAAAVVGVLWITADGGKKDLLGYDPSLWAFAVGGGAIGAGVSVAQMLLQSDRRLRRRVSSADAFAIPLLGMVMGLASFFVLAYVHNPSREDARSAFAAMGFASGYWWTKFPSVSLLTSAE